jgi:hypothetical protein
VVQRADDDGDHGEPDGLTQAGREEWRRFRNEFDSMRRAEFHRRHGSKGDDLDRDDVTEVRRAVLLAMSGTATRAGRGRQVGAGLIAVGSVGVAGMVGYLHSGAQIGLFVLLVVVGLLGVVVACLSGGGPG